MMISFVKIWTSVFNDPLFLKLKANGRGVWLQLLVYAKMVGGTGTIWAANWHTLSTILACDRRTLRRTLTFLQGTGEITVSERGGRDITIQIVNYKYWQGLKSGKDYERGGYSLTKMLGGSIGSVPPIEEKREEKNRGDVGKTSTPLSPSDLLKSLNEWAETPEAQERFRSLSLTPGYEPSEWIDFEFENLRAWVQQKPAEADRSFRQKHNEDWGDVFFAWLKISRRSGNQDKFIRSRPGGFSK